VPDGNLIVNGGFDTDLANWTALSGTMTRSTDDAVGCSSSGSMFLTTSLVGPITTDTLESNGDYAQYGCISTAFTAGLYNFGARVRLAPGSPPALLLFFPGLGSTCDTLSSVNLGGGLSSFVSPGTDWTPVAVQFTATGSGSGIGFQFVFGGGNGSAPAKIEIDDFYIARAPSVGWK
jgi:hypothetical protein